MDWTALLNLIKQYAPKRHDSELFVRELKQDFEQQVMAGFDDSIKKMGRAQTAFYQKVISDNYSDNGEIFDKSVYKEYWTIYAQTAEEFFKKDLPNVLSSRGITIPRDVYINHVREQANIVKSLTSSAKTSFAQEYADFAAKTASTKPRVRKRTPSLYGGVREKSETASSSVSGDTSGVKKTTRSKSSGGKTSKGTPIRNRVQYYPVVKTPGSFGNPLVAMTEGTGNKGFSGGLTPLENYSENENISPAQLFAAMYLYRNWLLSRKAILGGSKRYGITGSSMKALPGSTIAALPNKASGYYGTTSYINSDYINNSLNAEARREEARPKLGKHLTGEGVINLGNTFKEGEQKAKKEQRERSFLSELLKGIKDIMRKNPFYDLVRWGFLLLGKNHPILAAIGLSLPVLMGPLLGIVNIIKSFKNLLSGGKGGLLKGASKPAKEITEEGAKRFGNFKKFFTVQGAKTAGEGILKRIPIIGSALDVAFDIPDIITAHKSGKMSQQLSKTGGGIIGAVAGGILTGGNPLGVLAGNWLGRTIGEALGPGVQEFVDGIQSLVKSLWGIIGPILNWLGAKLRPVIERVGDAFLQVGRMIMSFGRAIDNFIKGTFNFVVNLVKSFGEGLGTVIGWFGKAASAISGFVDFLKTIPGVKNFLNDNSTPDSAAGGKKGDAVDELSKFQKVAELKKSGWTDDRLLSEGIVNKAQLHNYREYADNVFEEYRKAHGEDPKSKNFALDTNSLVLAQIKKDRGYAEQYGNVIKGHVEQKVIHGVKASRMKDLALYGSIDGKNSIPWVASENVSNLKKLDTYLHNKGYSTVYTSAMGGHGEGTGHGQGRKIDFQVFKNGKVTRLTADEMRDLKRMGFYDGVHSLGFEAVKNQVGGGHYDFTIANNLRETASKLSATQKATAVAENTNTSNAVATDGLRQSIAERVYGKDNALRKANEIIFTATDVTGSLGVWGITQVNNTGKMRI